MLVSKALQPHLCAIRIGVILRAGLVAASPGRLSVTSGGGITQKDLSLVVVAGAEIALFFPVQIKMLPDTAALSVFS